MWEVLVRRELRPLIDDLKGKKTGYADAYAQLQRDPCAIYPPGKDGDDGRAFAYRLSGPLRTYPRREEFDPRRGVSSRSTDRT